MFNSPIRPSGSAVPNIACAVSSPEAVTSARPRRVALMRSAFQSSSDRVRARRSMSESQISLSALKWPTPYRVGRDEMNEAVQAGDEQRIDGMRCAGHRGEAGQRHRSVDQLLCGEGAGQNG